MTISRFLALKSPFVHPHDYAAISMHQNTSVNFKNEHPPPWVELGQIEALVASTLDNNPLTNYYLTTNQSVEVPTDQGSLGLGSIGLVTTQQDNTRIIIDHSFSIDDVRFSDHVQPDTIEVCNGEPYSLDLIMDRPETRLDSSASNSPSPSAKKRATQWTQDEHKLFILGLRRYGKGDWKSISRNYVTTRSSTQVASHAQKYFKRQESTARRKRSSIHDIIDVDDNSMSELTRKGLIPPDEPPVPIPTTTDPQLVSHVGQQQDYRNSSMQLNQQTDYGTNTTIDSVPLLVCHTNTYQQNYCETNNVNSTSHFQAQMWSPSLNQLP